MHDAIAFHAKMDVCEHQSFLKQTHVCIPIF